MPSSSDDDAMPDLEGPETEAEVVNRLIHATAVAAEVEPEYVQEEGGGMPALIESGESDNDTVDVFETVRCTTSPSCPPVPAPCSQRARASVRARARAPGVCFVRNVHRQSGPCPSLFYFFISFFLETFFPTDFTILLCGC